MRIGLESRWLCFLFFIFFQFYPLLRQIIKNNEILKLSPNERKKSTEDSLKCEDFKMVENISHRIVENISIQ